MAAHPFPTHIWGAVGAEPRESPAVFQVLRCQSMVSFSPCAQSYFGSYPSNRRPCQETAREWQYQGKVTHRRQRGSDVGDLDYLLCEFMDGQGVPGGDIESSPMASGRAIISSSANRSRRCSTRNVSAPSRESSMALPQRAQDEPAQGVVARPSRTEDV